MFGKQKNRVRHALAFLLSVAMVFSMFVGNTVSIFAATASSIAVPSWAETRLYFHTIANDTTDSHAWAVMETTATSTGGTPSVGAYSSGTGFRVFLPETAKNSDGTYLVYNNYVSDITIGGKTIGSGKTGYVSASANTVRIGSNSTYSLKIYTSNAEENVYFTHSGSDTKNKNNGTINSAAGYVSALGLDWSKSSKSDAVVTNGNVTLVQADGTIDTSQTLKQIKGRGNSTWTNTNKKSWNFTLNDEKVSVGGMAKGKKYSLLANYQDPSLSRNRLLYDLADSVNVPYAADSRYTDVYMDGLYIGSYLLTQKNDSLADLVDPTYASDGSVANAEFMIELACATQGDDFEITPGNGSGILSVTYPEVDTLTSSQKSALKTFIKEKYDKLYNAICDSSKSYEDLSKLADVESLAKVYLINELSKNFDSGVSSFYLIYENGKFYASPVWDYDNSLGNANTSPVSDYKSPSGDWCSVWKGNGQSYSGNFVRRCALNPVVLDVARTCWFGESQDDTTSFVYNINKFAKDTSTQKTLGKNTGLLSKPYYSKVLNSSATNNFKKWYIVPNDWCSGHGSLKMYTVDYDRLYSKLNTIDYSVSSSISTSSSTRSYSESVITTSSNNGGQYEYAADYMISRAAWMSVNMLQTAKNYSLTGNKVGWTASLTDYKLSLTERYSGIYAIKNIDADLVTGYFKLNDGSSYIGPNGSSDVQITTETTYGSNKAYCVTGSVSGSSKSYVFSNPDNWSKVSVYYRPSDGKIWVVSYNADTPKSETIAAFKFDNTNKVAGEDLDEYTDGADTYTYLATTGDAKLTGSITGNAKKHMEWSSDDYANENGANAGIVPVFAASSSNSWTADANVTVDLSTKGYKELSVALQLGATKKGPANYGFYVTDGNSTNKLGTYSLSGNKTMFDVTLDIPDTFADKQSISILVKLENTTAVNGSDIVATTGGEFGINNIVITGTKNGVVGPTPTVKPTATPTGTNKVVVYYKRSASTSWTDAYIHYQVNNGTWTSSPGVKMTKVSAGYWSYTIDLGTQTGATVCFNNGANTWDSNNNANYTVGVGAYLVTSGTGVTRMDNTATPTVKPTATPTVKPTVTPTEGNKVVVYYKRSASTSWTNAYIHYQVNNGTWTSSPGVKMTKVSAGYWSYTIDLGTETGATVCFNNGANTWDSNNNANYTVGVGAYLVTSGTGVTRMDNTATPTVKPTATPTVKPTVTPTEGNKVVVYYKRSASTSWTNAYIHYQVNNGTWTSSPGVKMTKVSVGYWSYTIDLGTETGATVCFNNGANTWDSNNSANYTVGVGTYLVTSGTGVTRMDDNTATPTVKPTAVPTTEPTATPTIKPTVTPTTKPTATPTIKPTVTPTTEPTATPTVKPTETPVGANKVVVYYKRSTSTSWTNAYIHYKVNNGAWTSLPGVKMTKVSAGYWSYTIDLGTETGATVCFNNGANTWDSNNSANYTVGVGAYLVTSGTGVTRMDDNTATPTVKPTASPTVSPTITPTETPVGANKVVVYYKRSTSTSWTNAYIHYKVNNGAWTSSPGVKMTKVSAGYWSYTIDLGTETGATVCFNNGANTWDSNNSANYTVGVGAYLVTSGTGVTRMDNTASPTVTPTEGNKVVVYYKRSASTSWTNAYIHYKVDNGTWTSVPGVKMTKISAGYWSYTIDLGTETGATICFNNGSNSWDSNGGLNYTCTQGTYYVTN